MSAALVNRSLTNIRTELEFLFDSEVIDQELLDTLTKALPQKYAKDMKPWGVAALAGAKSTGDVTEAFAKTSIQDDVAPPAHAPPSHAPAPLPSLVIGYCKAMYTYDAQEKDDLQLQRDDRIAVLEHLSADWWKGYKQEDASKIGVFPSNYVSSISEAEFTEVRSKDEKAEIRPPAYNPEGAQQQYGYQQQQPSYGGYAQFPPASTNYYPPQNQQPPPAEVQQQQQQPQQAQGNAHPHLKKFGSKLGNAAIFGAGATIGSDLINLIF